MKPAVLIVDDEPDFQFGLSKALTKKGYAVSLASSLAEARRALASQRCEAILLDLRLPDGNGIDWIAELRESHPGIGVVVITGCSEIPIAVEAMRRGADNFLTKPVDLADLLLFLKKSVDLEALRRKELARQRLEEPEGPYWGESPPVKKLRDLASMAAEDDSVVLVQGETGTGKGLLARWIHDHSERSSRSFVAVNCSSLRGDLLASELFGHARGAFTSAHRDRPGLIEVADGGTLFLDEIAEMDLGIQPQFLNVLEEKQYRRLGDVNVRRSEFRVICATNRDFTEETRQGRFREDLYFRLNIFPIRVPALRDMTEDLPGLVGHILATLGAPGLEPPAEVMQLLHAYSWPGNIRELRNVLERALLLSRRSPLTPEHFPGLTAARQTDAPSGEVLDLKVHEGAQILALMDRYRGDVGRTAQALGVSKRTLYRKLKRLRGEH